ncbi:MAG: Co2+/Mg2+ efflux protein ApaG [Flavobacteriales bacterium]|nr:Co2+/Mg2+ efflux protein ApaG [Flavobacteriales bacterium]
MLQLLTSGISVSVKVFFEGTYFKNYILNYSYAYHITIENEGKEAVQLQSRHWEIIDSLRPQTIIDGEGVVGKKPVIYPSKTFSYKSGSLISSSIGAMRGHYNFINLATTKKFKAYIPKFKLSPAFALN